MTAVEIVAKVRELKEARGEIKPPKPMKDSPAANFICFWVLAILAGIGAAFMLTVTIAERPTAILPLMLFIGTAAASLGVLYNQLLGGSRSAAYDEKPWLRWFTATGIIIAMILAGNALFMLPAILF